MTLLRGGLFFLQFGEGGGGPTVAREGGKEGSSGSGGAVKGPEAGRGRHLDKVFCEGHNSKISNQDPEDEQG